MDKINDLSSGQISVNKNIRLKTSKLRSHLFDFSYTYIVIKSAKINNTFIENTENLDNVMPMYSLLEYRNNYFMTSGSLWNYYKDKVNNNANENNADNYGIYNKNK